MQKDLNNTNEQTQEIEKKALSRKSQRTHAMKLIYQSSFNIDFDQAKKIYFEENNLDSYENISYLKDTIKYFQENKEQIYQQIKSLLHENWRIERLNKIDLSIISVAIIDISNNKVPYKVAINEAINMAKTYSDEKAPKFINGILKDFVERIESNNEN